MIALATGADLYGGLAMLVAAAIFGVIAARRSRRPEHVNGDEL